MMQSRSLEEECASISSEVIQPKDVFNADECGLFLKLLPYKPYNFKDGNCHGDKTSYM
jgi:hypothetical protein